MHESYMPGPSKRVPFASTFAFQVVPAEFDESFYFIFKIIVMVIDSIIGMCARQQR